MHVVVLRAFADGEQWETHRHFFWGGGIEILLPTVMTEATTAPNPPSQLMSLLEDRPEWSKNALIPVIAIYLVVAAVAAVLSLLPTSISKVLGVVFGLALFVALLVGYFTYSHTLITDCLYTDKGSTAVVLILCMVIAPFYPVVISPIILLSLIVLVFGGCKTIKPGYMR